MNWYLKVLKQYVEFNGRARRKEYWMFALFNTLISILLGAIAPALEFNYLSTVYSLVILLPSLSVGVRRMHDVGKSGWFLLIPIYSLILACTNGDEGSNEYGPDPKNPTDELEEIGISEA